MELASRWKCITEAVINCIFRFTTLCVTIFAAVQHMSRKAKLKRVSLRIDVTTGFTRSVCYEGTSPKWMEWQGEMAGNLVLILNRGNFNVHDKTVQLVYCFMVRLCFVTSIQIASQMLPQWDSVTFAVLPYVMVGTDCSSQFS